MEKLIITAAICGAEVTKKHNPAVPYTVEEIADAIYAYNYVRPHQGIQMRTPMEYIRKCSGKVAEVPLVGTGAPAPILMDYASEF